MKRELNKSECKELLSDYESAEQDFVQEDDRDQLQQDDSHS